MPLTIQQAFHLPSPEEIRAMGFVIRLRDDEPDSPDMRKLVADYVVTPAVAKELPLILGEMRQVLDRGEEYGRFIHGSFGSGKSHFMALLGMLLEGVGHAWDKDDPCIQELAPNRQWIGEANLLVVRLHMLSVRGRETGLDRAVYEATSAALERRGKEPFNFVNAEGVIAEARKEAQEYGDAFWKKLRDAGIVGGPEDFEDMATGEPEDRELLAREYLRFKGRDADSAGIDPNWAQGLRSLTDHVKAQGFGGLVLLVDEFLLWLGEKSGQEFVREINDLNLIVDHATGKRELPVFVFVARQRNIREFFPDLVSEDRIHERLEHHAKRFEETRLQDVELRHIVKGRVLRPKQPEAVATAVAELGTRHKKLLPALIADADEAYLKDVYPFHPALIEMLVDVSSLMQRERSALRLLYELLVLHQPDLELGEFVPVGAAFDAIFPASGVEATRKSDDLQEIHRQYYGRLGIAMDGVAEEVEASGDAYTDSRREALDLLVKTVLLAEVSPRLRGKGLTVERLVQLNSAVVEGQTYRGRIRGVTTDILRLATRVPDLQLDGKGKTAVVRFALGRVSLGEVLGRARGRVDNNTVRLRTFYRTLKAMLGVAGRKGFRENVEQDKNVGDYEVRWRGTRRKGVLKLDNVRTAAYSDFEAPDGSFRILVDYPWDDAGHTVEDDRLRAQNARKKKGTQHTVCWLPRHLTPDELDLVTELAAVRFLISEDGQEEILSSMGRGDKEAVLDQAQAREKTLADRLERVTREVYVDQGEVVPLISDVDTRRPYKELDKDLLHFATLLMDRRYPGHPDFKAEPNRADLERLLLWMLDASQSGASVHYDEATGKALRALGQPLELVNLGQTKAGLRHDSRYIKDVLKRADRDSVSWEEIREHLWETYGLQPLVIDLFLCFVCSRGYRALHPATGELLKPEIGMRVGTPVRLQRGRFVSPAQWSRLRELGPQLLGVERPPPHRSLHAQDLYAEELREKAAARREVLQKGLHEGLVKRGIEEAGRLAEVAEANARLAPLARRADDSHETLTQLLEQWPDERDDPLRTVVSRAEAMRDALGALDEHARGHLLAAQEHPELGERVQAHLAALTGLLSSPEAERPLILSSVQDWNVEAQKLVRELVKKPPPKVDEPPPPPPPGIKEVRVLEGEQVDLANPDALGVFVGSLRDRLREAGEDIEPGSQVSVDVVLRVEEKEG